MWVYQFYYVYWVHFDRLVKQLSQLGLILVQDCATSRITKKTKEYCKENGITLITQSLHILDLNLIENLVYFEYYDRENSD